MFSSQFKDHVVLITGGTTGIGKSVAKAFADLGAKVVVAGRNEASGKACVDEIKAAGGEISFFKTDVSKESDVEALVDFTVKTYGSLDHCFNNAGVDIPGKPLVEFTVEEYELITSVDLKGVFLSMKHEIKQMLKQGKGGTIVNTSSVAGVIADPGMVLYVGAKHGVVGMTKVAGIEYIKQGIRVNGVAPGLTETPMTQKWLTDPEMYKVVTEQTPINRVASPDEMVGAVLYLSSDYSSFTAGHTLVVDGGQSAH